MDQSNKHYWDNDNYNSTVGQRNNLFFQSKYTELHL